MGSSRKIFTPPPPNPNAGGADASKSTYNIPVVSNYDSNNYQPFFTQQAVNPMSGLNPSFFNTYGSVGQDPAQVPYNPASNSNAGSIFALSAGRTTGLGSGFGGF
jgi:hypothetical protein